jgi:hypothetical protein
VIELLGLARQLSSARGRLVHRFAVLRNLLAIGIVTGFVTPVSTGSARGYPEGCRCLCSLLVFAGASGWNLDRTAYPPPNRVLTVRELAEAFTPIADEVQVGSVEDHRATFLALVVLLKCSQRLGTSPSWPGPLRRPMSWTGRWPHPSAPRSTAAYSPMAARWPHAVPAHRGAGPGTSQSSAGWRDFRSARKGSQPDQRCS